MPENRADDLGKIRCSLRGRVVAGSWQTCVLTYTAGFAGIDDTGSLKVVMRYATDAGKPQFDDPAAPNYTTAVASNGAHLQLRYDLKDHTRPWGKTIHIKVLQGYLRKGDRITLNIGDQSEGSPGWRMQTFREETFELRTLVDRYATYVYEPLPKSPTFRIVAGDPVRLVAVAPTLVQPGKRFDIRWRLEDIWGNPVGRSRKEKHKGFNEVGAYTVTINDPDTGLSAETNPIVIRDGDEPGRYWADLHGQSEETIGTNTIDDYFKFARDIAFVDSCAHQGNDFQITDEFWQTIQETTRKYNQPGKFVTFPGWEWSGNTGLGGDRNILFKEEGGLISRSSRALVDDDESTAPCSDDVEELFDRLENERDVMLIAHVGGRYADLNRHRERLEPAVEVHSAWGTFEWMLEDAFRLGYRVAIVANSDGHKGRPGASWPGASTFGSYGGLTCILADRLDRDAVWDAYQSRRVYATTGARIHCDFATTNGDMMGSVIEAARKTLPTFRGMVHGTGALERVELRNGMRVLQTLHSQRSQSPLAAPSGTRLKILWQGAEVRGRGRQVCWDGGLQITGNRIVDFQPINFHNPEQPCEQTGVDELEWKSLTTGGVAGVIVTLAEPGKGRLSVTTPEKSFKASIKQLAADGVAFDLGGVGKRISAYRLPTVPASRSLEFDYQPKWSDLKHGDNPIYIHVVLEDGHMAWTSPIYLVCGSTRKK